MSKSQGLAFLGCLVALIAAAPSEASAQQARVYNERGQHTLTVRPAPGRSPGSDRLILRDDRGRNAGYVRGNRIYNERGQNTGTVRRDWR